MNLDELARAHSERLLAVTVGPPLPHVWLTVANTGEMGLGDDTGATSGPLPATSEAVGRAVAALCECDTVEQALARMGGVDIDPDEVPVGPLDVLGCGCEVQALTLGGANPQRRVHVSADVLVCEQGDQIATELRTTDKLHAACTWADSPTDA